jgi:hypothetical protein
MPVGAGPETGHIHAIIQESGRTCHIPKTVYGEAHDIPEIIETKIRLCDNCEKEFQSSIGIYNEQNNVELEDSEIKRRMSA